MPSHVSPNVLATVHEGAVDGLDRQADIALLLELTQLPTAAGREYRVIDFITRWAAARPDLTLATDPVGNLTIAFADAPAPSPDPDAPGPIYITAHLDHPAFVLEALLPDATALLSFRGGVSDPYFQHARVSLFPHASTAPFGATLQGETPPPANSLAIQPDDKPPIFKHYLAKLDDPASAASLNVGDIATWELPPAEIDAAGLVHTAACDDLAAAAAALAAFDTLRARRADNKPMGDVRLLFTRAEEIGFIGAIGACKHRTMPRNARVIALENSRAFPDSPIGGGPIVRVGDRMSIFSPQLTAACAKRAEELFGSPAQPKASQTIKDLTGRAWQRKLMAGGACEATVFCSYGYTATCLCLPLGNYHNMSELDAVQAGTYDTAKLGPPRVGREYIALGDYLALIDLLVALGENLPDSDPALPRLENLFDSRKFVLE